MYCRGALGKRYRGASSGAVQSWASTAWTARCRAQHGALLLRKIGPSLLPRFPIMHRPRPRPRPSMSLRTTGIAVALVVVALLGLRACDQATAPPAAPARGAR